MATNKIIKYDLETRAKELKGQQKTNEDIAKILSDESKNKITLSTVFRYFESNKRAMAQAIEKSDKLKSKVVEAEILTIERRVKRLDFLADKIEESECLHDIAYATKVYNEAVDSLAKELGRLSTNPNVQINNINAMKIEDIPKEQIRGWMDEIRSLRAR